MTLSLNSVSKSFHDADGDLKVLEQVSYHFEEGKTVAIVGPSGVGKTTLLNILGGLERPNSGTVTIAGTQLSSLSEEQLASFRGRNVGFVFQFHHLLPEFSAEENVAMPLLLGGASQAAALEQAREILKKIGLAERCHHRPSQLSGGEQQRVSVARAVVSKPSVLLADEPTGNLDASNAELIRGLLFSLQRESNATLIIVTHSLELASSLDICLEMQPGGALVPKKS